MRALAASRNLNVLQISWSREAPSSRVGLTFARGSEEPEVLDVLLSDLGLSDEERQSPESRHRRSEERDPARSLSPSPSVGDDLRQLFGAAVGEAPLWLDLSKATGALAQIPWERWLLGLIEAPVLRLPYLPLQPAAVSDCTEILIVASMPRAKAEFPVAHLIGSLIDGVGELGSEAHFHVFVESHEIDEVGPRLSHAVDQGRVTLYPPEGARPYGVAPRSRSLEPEVANPWLRWMLGELGSTAIDCAVFLCHGFVSGASGALAFAESPLRDTDRRWSRFVGARQLGEFLDQIGASGVVCASPPQNYSTAGTYAVVDELARLRPGPALAVDMDFGGSGELAARVLSFLFAADPPSFPADPHLVLYCHPALLMKAGEAGSGSPEEDEDTVRRMERYTLAKSSATIPETSGSGPTRSGFRLPGTSKGGSRRRSTEADSGRRSSERWLASNQRILERHMAELSRLREPTSSVASATQKGKDEALLFVADLLKKAARRDGDDGEGS